MSENKGAVIEIAPEEVSIRCMGCSQNVDLERAMREGWRMCVHCQYFICAPCRAELGTPPLCLSYPCSHRRRVFSEQMIPADKILIFAREQEHSFYKEGLLYKLFYRDRECVEGLPIFRVQSQGNTPGIDETSRPTKIQEEVWKNHHLVVTKRRGGKFITWEKIL